MFPISAILVFFCPCSNQKLCEHCFLCLFKRDLSSSHPLMLLTRWNNNISIIHFTSKRKQQYIWDRMEGVGLKKCLKIIQKATLMYACRGFPFAFPVISSAAESLSDLWPHMINVVTITHSPSSVMQTWGWSNKFTIYKNSEYIVSFPASTFQLFISTLHVCCQCISSILSASLQHLLGKQFGKCISGIWHRFKRALSHKL